MITGEVEVAAELPASLLSLLSPPLPLSPLPTPPIQPTLPRHTPAQKAVEASEHAALISSLCVSSLCGLGSSQAPMSLYPRRVDRDSVRDRCELRVDAH